MTRREKIKAYRTTASYRRLHRWASVAIALWAAFCFWTVSFPREARVFSLGANLAFWLVAGLVMWFAVRFLLTLVAGFIPDAKLQTHLREGSKEAVS